MSFSTQWHQKFKKLSQKTLEVLILVQEILLSMQPLSFGANLLPHFTAIIQFLEITCANSSKNMTNPLAKSELGELVPCHLKSTSWKLAISHTHPRNHTRCQSPSVQGKPEVWDGKNKYWISHRQFELQNVNVLIVQVFLCKIEGKIQNYVIFKLLWFNRQGRRRWAEVYLQHT